jgi:hypothetical protein
MTASELSTATVSASVNAEADTLIEEWVSPSGMTFSSLESGVYDLDLYVERTAGNRTVRVFWRFYEYLADTSEVLIVTSNTSEIVTSKARVRVYATLSSDYTPSAGSMLVGKVYFNTVGGSQNTTCVIYYQGTEDSHWQIPINQEFLDDNYANTTLSNLGTTAINTSLISDTDNTDALGDATHGWSDLFLGSGAVINFNNGDVTLTHSENNLALAGGNLSIGSNQLTAGIANVGTQLVVTHDSDTIPPYIDLRRGKDGDPTDDVADTDNLGEIRFRGYKTDGYYAGAAIRATVNGTPGSDDMPGKIELATSADGSSTPTTRVTIDATGVVNVAGLTASQAVTTDASRNFQSTAIGIANSNIVRVDAADVADNDYAKFTANGLEGKSYAEARADLLTLGSDADGDMYYRASSDLTRLAKGTARQTLRMNSGATAPEWHSTIQTLVIACSDEATALTIGLAKVTFRMPFAMTLLSGKEGVRASVNTAPVGSTIEVDINEGGSTILSTILSIDASEETSYTAATEVVISDTALADDAEITIDIDQVGSSTAGKGLKVMLRGFIT